MVDRYRIGEFNNSYHIHQFGTIVAENIQRREAAEFICCACNAHYGLLEMCEKLYWACAEMNIHMSETLMCEVKAAIDQAKGEK